MWRAFTKQGRMLVVQEFQRVESNTPQCIPAHGGYPHCRANRLSGSRSSLKVANTALDFRPALEARLQTFSRAPTSITGCIRLQHRPVFQTHSFVSSPPLGFRFRRLQIIACFLFTGCSLSELQATAKLRNRRYLPIESVGLRQRLTTALRTKLGAHAVVRCPKTHH